MLAAVDSGLGYSLSTISRDGTIEVRCLLYRSCGVAHAHAPATALLFLDYNHAPDTAIDRLLIFSPGLNRAFLVEDCAM